MWLNQMQEAFIDAVDGRANKKLVSKVAKAAERIKLGADPKSSIKLSFKTAQKLKQVGVLV